MSQALTRGDRIKSFRLSESDYKAVAEYADVNSMTVSEAMREILGVYARGEVTPPARKRRTRRVAIWIDPAEWIAFRKRADHDKVQISDAIETAIREAL